ncbi:MAG: PadR family transcriptional regulator [Acidobacteria bacterium]|nr:PadR family transcriptional regulator [Acidobacteriota bacterium]
MGDRASELLPGTLDILVLKALTRGPLHGYAVMQWIEQASDDALHIEEGALYPALHRLELKGWLAGEWGRSENNRRAKFYRLTEAGREHLAGETTRWNRGSAAVSRVLAAT